MHEIEIKMSPEVEAYFAFWAYYIESTRSMLGIPANDPSNDSTC
jgi:hypothetical protein